MITTGVHHHSTKERPHPSYGLFTNSLNIWNSDWLLRLYIFLYLPYRLDRPSKWK